jgi:hypothetical protein
MHSSMCKSASSIHGNLSKGSSPSMSISKRSMSTASNPVMQYRNLGSSGLKVSALSFGSWLTFGDQVH